MQEMRVKVDKTHFAPQMKSMTDEAIISQALTLLSLYYKEINNGRNIAILTENRVYWRDITPKDFDENFKK